MNFIQNMFQFGPIPSNAMNGTYNYGLVALSYVIAVMASYVALDLAGRLQAEKSTKAKVAWLLGGAFAMGAGIWSMHFIGMLAFIMPMPMGYDLFWTISSMIAAILASTLALYLLRSAAKKFSSLILGGVLIGIGIVTMHYMGMEGMEHHVNIHYLPSLFLLSILIAIVASEAALWLAMQANRGTYRRQLQIKIGSALVMGAAICGMHYTGMAAAVFTPLDHAMPMENTIEPFSLALYVAAITGAIITIALIVSTYKQLLVSAVQNEKNFLNAMLDNLEDGIIACDSKGKINLINKTLQKKLHLPDNFKISNEILKYLHLTPVDEKDSQEPIKRVLKGEKIENLALTMKLDNNVTRDIVMDGQPIISNDGKKLGAVAVLHDITERLRVEKLKNEFVSTVSHELRTPLTSIRGSLGLVMGGKVGELNEKTKELLTIAHNNCERLIRLINDILDVEKIEAGKMDFEIHPIFISEIIDNAILINMGFAEKFNVKIKTEGKIPDIKVNVDRDRLIQVMTNLISNAVKFSPPKSTVLIGATALKNSVKVTVTDTGKGIAKEFQDRVFDKFAQADSSNMRKQGGTGLGLNISHKIIEKMGGNLGFTTKQDVGTTFYFQLPIWQKNISPLKSKKQPRILICEDDKDIASLLGMVLSENGFEIETAHTIAEAQKVLQNNSIDAMTLDLILPDGDGISLVQELRKDKKYSKLPIIIISAKLGEKGRLVNGDAINIVDWLNKPVDSRQLAEAIKHIKKKLKPKNPSILHVEDDTDLLKIIASLLEGDAKLSGASTLKEARKALENNKFDLVLLDLVLPDGSGVELLPQLSKLKIPVIVFSAFEVPKDYVQYVTTALTKSRTSETELVAAIKAAVNTIGGNNART